MKSVPGARQPVFTTFFHGERPGWPMLTRLLLSTFHPECAAGSSRSFTATRKDAGLCCGSRLRSGEVFTFLGEIKTERTKCSHKGLNPLRTKPHALPGPGHSPP